jgi:large subunit ribosomal protein L4
MMKLEVYSTSGAKTSKSIELDDAVFGVEPNDHAIYLDVKRIQAAKRQGTHDTLHRGVVSGSTRKLKRQKGTGTARAGSIKNPLFRGGGTIFGPEPRNYRHKLNNKVKMLARRSALSYKAQGSAIKAVESFEMNAPKTKELVAIFNSLNLGAEKTLMVLPDANSAIYLSARNLPKQRVMCATDLSTYDIMNCKTLVLVGNAHEVLTGMLKK